MGIHIYTSIDSRSNTRSSTVINTSISVNNNTNTKGDFKLWLTNKKMKFQLC